MRGTMGVSCCQTLSRSTRSGSRFAQVAASATSTTEFQLIKLLGTTLAALLMTRVDQVQTLTKCRVVTPSFSHGVTTIKDSWDTVSIPKILKELSSFQRA